MRVLIVDDEALARTRLRRLLATVPDVEIVGEASDGAQAMELAATRSPDVLLLDVQMPEVDGFAVAASLPDDGPAVIFVTAFDAYAIRAFEARAVDYLLKPVAPERLAGALQRVRMHTHLRASALAAVAIRRLLVPTRRGLHVLHVGDIEWLAAADNYVTLHTPTGEFLLRRALAHLLDELGEGFMRVHRSAAVSLDRVVRLQTNDRGDATLELRSGAQVACSRLYRDALVRRLQPSPG